MIHLVLSWFCPLYGIFASLFAIRSGRQRDSEEEKSLREYCDRYWRREEEEEEVGFEPWNAGKGLMQFFSPPEDGLNYELFAASPRLKVRHVGAFQLRDGEYVLPRALSKGVKIPPGWAAVAVGVVNNVVPLRVFGPHSAETRPYTPVFGEDQDLLRRFLYNDWKDWDITNAVGNLTDRFGCKKGKKCVSDAVLLLIGVLLTGLFCAVAFSSCL